MSPMRYYCTINPASFSVEPTDLLCF